MTTTRARGVIAAGVALLACAGAGAAHGANVVLDGWGTVTADMGGGALVWSDTQAAKTKTFTYWRTDTGRAAAGGSLGAPSEPVLVRTSSGISNGARVRATGVARGYVTIAPGAAYAGPVIWCCDSTSTEVVVSSDGRGDAPRPVGAGLDGDRVRWIASGPGGAVLGAGSPVEGDLRETSITIPGNPGPFQASIAPGVAAWADQGGSSLYLGVPSDSAMGNLRQVPQGGRIRSVLATSTYVVTVVTSGGRTKVLRTAVAGGGPRTVWTGSGTPQVGMSGGVIAVGSSSTVLTSRSGGKARKAYTAKGPIAAIATDGRRVVVFERVTRKVAVGKRTKQVKSTVGRVIGAVR